MARLEGFTIGEVARSVSINYLSTPVSGGPAPLRSLASWGTVCGNSSGFVVNISTESLG